MSWMQQWIINTTHWPETMLNVLNRKLQRAMDLEEEQLNSAFPQYAGMYKYAQQNILKTIDYVLSLDTSKKHRSIGQWGGPMFVDATPTSSVDPAIVLKDGQ